MRILRLTDYAIIAFYFGVQSVGSRTNSMLLIRESVAYHYFFLPPVAKLVRNYLTERLLGLQFDAPLLFIPGVIFHLYFPFWLFRLRNWNQQTGKQKLGISTLGLLYLASLSAMLTFSVSYLLE